jgi:hypothetical protein
MVCLRFEVGDYETWAHWLDTAAGRLDISDYRVYRDNEDPATVDVCFPVAGEARARGLGAAIADGARATDSGALHARFIAAPRTLL